ncbi:hypothetical protein H0H87_005822 [Tephrocybe sp. NHM501043]|nr:hypothetical protein H0H87_005822 [Tephrocybe sp. NHM501043]
MVYYNHPQNGASPSPNSSIPAPNLPPAPANAQTATLCPKCKQVKMVCTNCANACKRCDKLWPCERCIKYNTPETCVDGQRKEHKKGIKHGPYKRKNKSDVKYASMPPPPHTHTHPPTQ